MNNTITFVFLLVGIIGIFSMPQITNATIDDDITILSNDNSLFVCLEDNDEMIVVEGKVYHNEEWKNYDLQSLEIEYFENHLTKDGFWITGLLESGEQVWFTHSIFNGTQVTGVFVYDGENLYEDYAPMIKS